MVCSKSHSMKKDLLFISIFVSLLTILFFISSVPSAHAAGKAYVTDIYGTNVNIVDLSTNTIVKTNQIIGPTIGKKEKINVANSAANKTVACLPWKTANSLCGLNIIGTKHKKLI